MTEAEYEFFSAVMEQDRAKLGQILDAGVVSVDARIFGHGATALYFALGMGEEIIRLLLERGATANIEEWEEVTPLENAIWGRDPEIVRLLLRYGADPSYRTFRGTPLEKAHEIGAVEIEKLLRDAGAEMTTIREEANRAGFPSFVPLLERNEKARSVLYPALLFTSPFDAYSRSAVQMVREVIKCSPDAVSEVAALLGQSNWCPKLVGAFAIVMGVADKVTFEALWRALDVGSSVAPHLATSAFLRDPNFLLNARQRMEAGCPIDSMPVDALGWTKRDSAAGIDRLAVHYAKLFSALVYLCRLLPGADSTDSWLSALLAAPEAQACLAVDIDNGDQIAEQWLKRVDEAIAEEMS